jgi:hypothetical protein
LRLLAVNNQSVPIVAAINIKGWLPHVAMVADAGGTTGARSGKVLRVNVTTLSAGFLEADNPPGNPTLISPKTTVILPGSSAAADFEDDDAINMTRATWSSNGTDAHTFPPLSVSAIVLAVVDDDGVERGVG